MTPALSNLLELAERLITWRESDAGLSWEEFLVQQKDQHEELRRAISAVRAEYAAKAA